LKRYKPVRRNKMYQRILVPLDGSKLAEQALPHAAVHAGKFGAEVVLLKVLGPLAEPSMAGRGPVLRAEEASARLARDYLQGLAAGLREQGLSFRPKLSRANHTSRSSALLRRKRST
jgi:nucleotide-binding universal stress UspA family protein